MKYQFVKSHHKVLVNNAVLCAQASVNIGNLEMVNSVKLTIDYVLAHMKR